MSCCFPRARFKEEAFARKQLEEEHERLEREQEKTLYALALLLKQGDEEGVRELQAKNAEISLALERVIEREANVKAGYVYVISNVGSFGPGIVKIGMTRRVDPMDRVRELGDASVPFRFDVHTLFFSDSAADIEASLHRTFAAQRVNLVNKHREYFYVTPLDVKHALLSLRGNLLSFDENPEAAEFHQSSAERMTAFPGGLPDGKSLGRIP